VSGRPGALRRRAPLRTGRAPFNASGSSKTRKVGRSGALRSARSAAGRPRVRSPRPRSRRLTCPLVRGVIVDFSFRGSPDHVSSLSRPSTWPGIRPVIRDDQLEALALLPWFPAAFRRPALASWSSCARRGIELSLRSADRSSRRDARTPTGFPRSARSSNDRGGCPLYPGDDGAHPDRPRSPARACRITATRPYTPPQPSIHTGLCLTRHQPRVQAISPVRSSPRR
jgi:hypothetical protein